jgi:hypothetical protein
MSKFTTSGPQAFLLAVERFMGRAGRLTLASALVAAPAVNGCAPPGAENDFEDAEDGEEALLGGGQTDWAQKEGQRNSDMVSYYGESWRHLTDCGSRGGCQGVDLFIKLRVRPAEKVDLDKKRVGVVYRAPGETNPITATGSYFTTWENGDEEWHVKVHLRSWQSVISFNAWYQDGAGHTFFEDNDGDLHPIAVGGSNAAIQQMWSQNGGVKVDQSGVHGTVAVRLADLGFDKDVAIVWTTDGWETDNWFGMADGANGWRWTQDYGADYEKWEIDLAIDEANVETFEYAIVYRHGGNEGKTYEFWDNNFGQNYKVQAP